MADSSKPTPQGAPLNVLIVDDAKPAQGAFAETFIRELSADRNRLRAALEVLLVPYRDALKSGTPAGVYVQRFRFEQAELVLKQTE